VRYPVIIISEDPTVPFVQPPTSTEDALRKLLEHSTARAINTGFYDRALIVDSDMRTFRIKRLELTGRRILKWPSRRAIAGVEIELAGEDFRLGELKERVAGGILLQYSVWNASYDVQLLIDRIGKAESFKELVDAFARFD
jgi:hypothetical protein